MTEIRDERSRAEHDDDDDAEAPEHLWQSREVRWSATSGMLLLIGFVAERFAVSARSSD